MNTFKMAVLFVTAALLINFFPEGMSTMDALPTFGFGVCMTLLAQHGYKGFKRGP